jgi:hypothetical protein
MASSKRKKYQRYEPDMKVSLHPALCWLAASPSPRPGISLNPKLGAWHIPPLNHSRQFVKFASKNFFQKSAIKRDGPVFFSAAPVKVEGDEARSQKSEARSQEAGVSR